MYQEQIELEKDCLKAIGLKGQDPVLVSILKLSKIDGGLPVKLLEACQEEVNKFLEVEHVK